MLKRAKIKEIEREKHLEYFKQHALSCVLVFVFTQKIHA